MKKITILIIEDNAGEAALLSQALNDLGYEVVATSPDLESALIAFYSLSPDIVIADIMLHGKSDGITFAERIGQLPGKARPVIFLTSSMDRSTFLSAKSTHPVSYLLKPFHSLELEFAIELAVEAWGNNTGSFAAHAATSLFIEEHFFIKKRESLVKLPMDNILLLEVNGKYCHIIGEEGKFLVQKSLKEMMSLLPETKFLRTHRNYVVNLKYIRSLHLQDNSIELTSGASVPVSREYKKQFTDKFRILM